MTEAERTFRLERTLGAIIEMVDDSPVISNAVKTLCTINQIDPHEVQQVYRNWQARAIVLNEEGELMLDER